ncbi:dihydrolipoyl dehydrogenase family protein [Nonomuraea sp. NPDC050556]|uniref:dihydrolipoyl dehydrogenase family protein n=1 Tax=Nonomuraea sp. NPDC050556 TaxID=3364369 RepID=UPI0037A32071
MDVDVIVLGLGPGGEDVAGRLAEAGLRVAGVEANLVGGECPYWGCIPSKMMIHEAAKPDASWERVARRIRDEATDNWDDKVAADRFTGKGGILVRGRGRITGPRTVTVGEVITASRGIVIASGSQPSVPPIDGLADTPYWTNHEAIETATLPSSLIVLGGGAIGAELAHAFSRFGSTVTVVEAAPRLLALEEPEAGELVASAFGSAGIRVLTGATVSHVSYADGQFSLAGVSASQLLVATGRRVDLAALGVGAVGLDESARAIPTDGLMRAGDGVWALGDAVGKGAFTHMSMYHADIVVKDILGQEVQPASYHAVPRVTFTDPEIGAVGLTEAQAREQGLSVQVALTDLAKSTRGWIAEASGFIKLVASDGVLVGATSAGPCGGEVLSMLTLAVHERVPVQRLREMIYAYPTFHRAVSAALAELGGSA